MTRLIDDVRPGAQPPSLESLLQAFRLRVAEALVDGGDGPSALAAGDAELKRAVRLYGSPVGDSLRSWREAAAAAVVLLREGGTHMVRVGECLMDRSEVADVISLALSFDMERQAFGPQTGLRVGQAAQMALSDMIVPGMTESEERLIQRARDHVRQAVLLEQVAILRERRLGTAK
jgi:hypothetical protein